MKRPYGKTVVIEFVAGSSTLRNGHLMGRRQESKPAV